MATLNTTAVSGNITVTGTVDGRDVSVDGAKLDNIELKAQSLFRQTFAMGSGKNNITVVLGERNSSGTLGRGDISKETLIPNVYVTDYWWFTNANQFHPIPDMSKTLEMYSNATTTEANRLTITWGQGTTYIDPETVEVSVMGIVPTTSSKSYSGYYTLISSNTW